MYSVEEQTAYSAIYPDIILHEDGVLEGGVWMFGMFDPYQKVAPYSVQIDDSGALTCELVEGWKEYDEYGDVLMGGGGVCYLIYPAGVPDPYFKVDDTNKVRLTYRNTNGGVFEANYTKIN